uniref:Uncharacterized protein n=1 Tax=Rhizophora mucronata TaxID=61149 RepID=A0A2P2NAI3_RHIMU
MNFHSLLDYALGHIDIEGGLSMIF